jgi:hypothetical protein
MRKSSKLIAIAATGIVVVSSAANGQSQAGTAPAAPASAAAPDRKLLMDALDEAGAAKTLDDLRLNIYGYVQGGYFYDVSSHNSSGPTYIGLNGNKNEVVLDKIDLNLERTVDPTKRQLDWGFHIEGIYGADASLIHSNGMFDEQTGEYQWDPLLQAYVDITLADMPVRLRVGKWIELAGFEHFSANIYGAFGDPSKALYSYSYQFLYAEPGTQTGILGTYVFNSELTVDTGITRGWNQSTEDTNDAIDFLGRVIYTPSDKTAVTFVMTEGPEYSPAVGPSAPSGDNGDWWTALDMVITQKITDQLSLGLGIDYVNAPHIPGFSGAQQWGGAAGYASYAIDPHLTFNSRVEWYHDTSGFSTGVALGDINYYEATIGLAIKPFPNDKVLSNLLFRPEIRYDYSDKDGFADGQNDQLTFSFDALFMF